MPNELELKIERLAQALRFYADESQWMNEREIRGFPGFHGRAVALEALSSEGLRNDDDPLTDILAALRLTLVPTNRERMVRRAEVVLSRGDRVGEARFHIPWNALPKSTRRSIRTRYHDRAVELVDALLSEEKPS
jgi:hypothetical protein